MFLYTAGADGPGLITLVVSNSEKGFMAGEMAWSPDGRELAFMQQDLAAGERGVCILYAIGQDGSGLRKLAEVYVGRWLSSLSWSPNGDEILVVSERAMYVAKADGSGYREVAQASYASWSPDGSEIVVAYQTPNDALSVYLAVVAPDGSNKRLLVIKEIGGSLRAARPGNKRCLLWICW